MHYLLLFIPLLMACNPHYHSEFNKIKPLLSSHFHYTIISSEITYEENCKKYTFTLEGKAKRELRLKDYKNIFLNTSIPPKVLDVHGLSRFITKQIEDLKMRGIQERCLEEKDSECKKYYFRHFTPQDEVDIAYKIEKEYHLKLSMGEALENSLQLKLCPQKDIEVSYLVQEP